MKHCPQCDQDLPKSAFGLSRREADNLTCWCKECRNRKARERYAESPKIRATRAKSRDAYRKVLIANPERHARQKGIQRQWHRDQLANDPDWRDKENARRKKAYYNRTPEQKEHARQIASAWREANREHYNRQHREYVKRRYHTDPEFKKNLSDWFARRRNIQRGNGGSYTKQEWDDLCLLAGYRCVRCGEIKTLTVDHIIPVSLGGGSDITNLQPLCESCNKSKGSTEMDYRSLVLAACMEPSYSERGVNRGNEKEV